MYDDATSLGLMRLLQPVSDLPRLRSQKSPSEIDVIQCHIRNCHIYIVAQDGLRR